MERLDEGYSYVVMTDIAAFFENIDIATLISDLRAAAAPEDAVAQLSTNLNRWAQVGGRGIPQGSTASDILAKLYLNSVDHNLREAGFTHYR